MNLREKQVAYHEAGHAVTAVLTRYPVKNATIVPEVESLGHVSHYNLPPSIKEDCRAGVYEGATRRWLFRSMVSCQAGVIAAAKGIGVNPKHTAEGGIQDFETLVDYAHAAFGDYQEKVYQSYREADKLLDVHWKAVQAVAAALMEHKTLSGKRVRAIVMENGGRRYLVRGGQKSVEIKNRGARATIDSQGRIHMPPPDENEVLVWHEQPMTVEVWEKKRPKK